MEYNVTQVQNVLRNYQGILAKKKSASSVEKPLSQQNVKADRINISKEALEMLKELKASAEVEKQPPPSDEPSPRKEGGIGTELV